MNLVQPIKFQSDARCNPAMRKSDERTKHCLIVRLIRSLFATTLLGSH